MTITDIQNSLVTHFLKKTTFTVSSDSLTLNIPNLKAEDTDLMKSELIKSSLIRAALSKMEEIGLVKGVAVNGETDFYVLVSPMDKFTQEITISPACADLIAGVINTYREAYHVSGDACDKLGITENDIANLAFICQNLLNEEKGSAKQ